MESMKEPRATTLVLASSLVFLSILALVVQGRQLLVWDGDLANNSSSNSTGRQLAASYSSNPIDDCWRGDANWAENRMKLAQCGIGFGSNAGGGKDGEIYVVTDSSDDSAVDPKPGTLRYGVVQLSPLWITFEHDMTITLQTELIVTSYKTLDGRGANVHITGHGCITIQDVNNVIIHGLRITDCKPSSPGLVMSSVAHVGHRQGSDGDGISIFTAQNIWIDHNYLSNCYDGLVDAVHGSSAITISNNQFANHNKVMLLGHDDGFTADKGMKVTVAYNHFGPGCVQRMPRCRLGYFHVVHNDYESWEMYAVGGSGNPTIISEGNHYAASTNPNAKEVTKRDCDCSTGTWSGWTWKSSSDIMMNGAFFVESGNGQVTPTYGTSLSSSSYSPSMTADAGTLSCSPGAPC